MRLSFQSHLDDLIGSPSDRQTVRPRKRGHTSRVSAEADLDLNQPQAPGHFQTRPAAAAAAAAADAVYLPKRTFDLPHYTAVGVLSGSMAGTVAALLALAISLAGCAATTPTPATASEKRSGGGGGDGGRLVRSWTDPVTGIRTDTFKKSFGPLLPGHVLSTRAWGPAGRLARPAPDADIRVVRLAFEIVRDATDESIPLDEVYNHHMTFFTRTSRSTTPTATNPTDSWGSRAARGFSAVLSPCSSHYFAGAYAEWRGWQKVEPGRKCSKTSGGRHLLKNRGLAHLLKDIWSEFCPAPTAGVPRRQPVGHRGFPQLARAGEHRVGRQIPLH